MPLMEDVLFIVNPRAGSGAAGRVWTRMCDRMPALRRATIVECGDPALAGAAMAAALTPRIRRVVAVGGDGTLHATVNLLLQHAPDPTCSLGLVPVGTGSDLARGLGLARQPAQALAQALDAAPVALDVLRLEAGGQTRHFINEASLGITAGVAARVNAQPRRHALAFLAAALQELAHYRPRWARITLDGQLWREGYFTMLVVANGSHFGKGMRIAPMADPCDGQADIIVVDAVSTARLLAWLPSIYLGRHVGAPFIHCARARTIDIEAASAAPEPASVFEGDGEVTLPMPGRITLMPGAVSFRGMPRRRNG